MGHNYWEPRQYEQKFEKVQEDKEVEKTKANDANITNLDEKDTDNKPKVKECKEDETEIADSCEGKYEEINEQDYNDNDLVIDDHDIPIEKSPAETKDE